MTSKSPPRGKAMFDRERLDSMVADGWLRSQRHPDADLWIYNYTPKTQYEDYWTPETLACRGLILGADGEVIARPFPKFFNYGDSHHGTEQLPNEQFVVTEKIDGSLGIYYQLGGEPCIATRGSFTSEQATEGTMMLREHSLLHHSDTTPLFEIVYPDNRIVVDYGDRRELILLAAVSHETGNDVGLPGYSGPVVKRHNSVGLPELLGHNRPNHEGYVVTFESGLRVKIKHADYVRLHKLITGVNARHIWEHLKEDDDLESMLDGIPDELHSWISDVRDELHREYKRTYHAAIEAFNSRPANADRKTLAAYFKDNTDNPALCFSLLDGKPIKDMIWKAIKPEPSRSWLGYKVQDLKGQ